MPAHYDPMQDRIDTRAQMREDALAAECNRLAAERDLLQKERDEYRIEADCTMRDFDALELEHSVLREERDALAVDKQRLLQGVANLLAHNRRLSDQLRRALSPERSAA